MASIRLFIDHPRAPALKKRELVARTSRVFALEHKPVESVNVILTTDEQVLAINRQYLNHDYETDVISFELQQPGDPVIGEIYISVDQARRQATEFGVTSANEINRLAIHGALHLCGYDDQSPEQQGVMREKENLYLELNS